MMSNKSSPTTTPSLDSLFEDPLKKSWFPDEEEEEQSKKVVQPPSNLVDVPMATSSNLNFKNIQQQQRKVFEVEKQISSPQQQPKLTMEAVIEAFAIEYPPLDAQVKTPNFLRSLSSKTSSELNDSAAENDSKSSSFSSTNTHTMSIKTKNPLLTRLAMNEEDCTIHGNNILAIPFRPHKISDLELAFEAAARILVCAKAKLNREAEQIKNSETKQEPATTTTISPLLQSRPRYLFDFEVSHSLDAPSLVLIGPYVVVVELMKNNSESAEVVRKSKILTSNVLDYAARAKTRTFSAREIVVRGVARNSTSGRTEATAMMTFHL
jgi:hypothetical protein